MSRSPTLAETREGTREDAAMTEHHTRLMRLLRSGRSLSGHERNCSFLNTGDGRFATVSQISGFDFPDDGRGLGLVDWDCDGDIDIWTTNRSAPQIRLLDNRTSNGKSLMIRLRGTSANADGIGARVEVKLENGRVLVREAHAGEGYLSQRSRWLHFGLGDANPLGVTIHWPGGEAESHPWTRPGNWLVATQGRDTPELWTPPAIPEMQETPPLEKGPSQNHVGLTYPVPLPRVYRVTADSPEPIPLPATTGKPTLLILWANWCQTCRSELKKLVADRRRLENVDVLVLHADQLTEDPGAEPQKQESAEWLASIGFPFHSARASDETVNRLHYLSDILFARQTDLTVPLGFLVSPSGKVSAVYRGSVSTERVLRDVKSLDLGGAVRQDTLLPFPGRWQNRPQGVTPVGIAADLARRGAFEDTREYVEGIRDELKEQSLFARVAEWLGDESVKRNAWADALRNYRDVVSLEPGNLAVLNNLAYHLVTVEDQALRNPDEATKHAESAAALSGRNNPQVLDTLATVYQASGNRTQALRVWKEALTLAKRGGDRKLMREMERKIRE